MCLCRSLGIAKVYQDITEAMLMRSDKSSPLWSLKSESRSLPKSAFKLSWSLSLNRARESLWLTGGRSVHVYLQPPVQYLFLKAPLIAHTKGREFLLWHQTINGKPRTTDLGPWLSGAALGLAGVQNIRPVRLWPRFGLRSYGVNSRAYKRGVVWYGVNLSTLR